MKPMYRFGLGIAFALALCVGGPQLALFAQDAAAPREVMNTYDLMEAMVGPTQEALSEGLAAEPADKRAWRDVRRGAFSLAEMGNLLLFRNLEEEWDAAAFTQGSVEFRELSEAMALAAKERDYAKTKAAYEAVVKSCNACHQKIVPDDAIEVEL